MKDAAPLSNSGKTKERVGLGITLILASTIFTSTQDAAIKYASSDMPISQLFVLRSLLLIPILLAIASFWGQGFDALKGAFRSWPLVRSAMFVMMYVGIYTMLPVLPLSAIAGGLYTAPLFVALLSPFLLNQTVKWWEILAILIGFGGVLVILQPGTDAFSWALLVPVMGGFFYALSAIVTRTKCREENPATLAVSLSFTLLVVCLIMSGLIAWWQPAAEIVTLSPFLFGDWTTLTIFEWCLVGFITLLMVGNGLVLPAAYQVAPTVIIATFDYCYLIFASLLGFLLFSEIPTASTILGIFMIGGAGLMIVWMTDRANK